MGRIFCWGAERLIRSRQANKRWFDRSYRPPGTTAGSYFVIALADADNTDDETNEGNNITFKKLKVTP